MGWQGNAPSNDKTSNLPFISKRSENLVQQLLQECEIWQLLHYPRSCPRGYPLGHLMGNYSGLAAASIDCALHCRLPYLQLMDNKEPPRGSLGVYHRISLRASPPLYALVRSGSLEACASHAGARLELTHRADHLAEPGWDSHLHKSARSTTELPICGWSTTGPTEESNLRLCFTRQLV